jgi:SAM-dependent methyltransferase
MTPDPTTRCSPGGSAKAGWRRPEFLARLARSPDGAAGRLLAALMSWETRKENDACLAMLRIKPGDQVLEIGFGHGRWIEAAAKQAAGGLVAGVDFCAEMVAMARKRNRTLVEQRVEDLRQADSREMPFPNGCFDKAFSVHTIYFWQDPVAHLREIRRVLKARGRFVLGFRPDSEEVRRSFPDSVYRFRTGEQIRRMVLEAGFASAELMEGGEATRGVAMVAATNGNEITPIVSQPGQTTRPG